MPPFHDVYGIRNWLGPLPTSIPWIPYGIPGGFHGFQVDSIWIIPGKVKTSPIRMANMTHHLPLPTARTAPCQHPHCTPHLTNSEHCPPLPTIFDNSPPPAPTNCEDSPASHTNGDDGLAQFSVVYISMYAITCIFFKFS